MEVWSSDPTDADGFRVYHHKELAGLSYPTGEALGGVGLGPEMLKEFMNII
ncbi:MAG: hypothetical protein LBJ36_07100 [Synergistaceae bacterium]|nr:hypothetical protein [Synergistaceae bacterium]